MSRVKLNIVKKTDQFESVEFVNDMSELQLKVMIKRLFKNFGDFANLMDNKNRKVSNIIDVILDGHTWKDSDVGERFSYFYYEGETIVYDHAEDKFAVQHNDKTLSTFDGMTRREIDQLHKKITKARKSRKS